MHNQWPILPISASIGGSLCSLRATKREANWKARNLAPLSPILPILVEPKSAKQLAQAANHLSSCLKLLEEPTSVETVAVTTTTSSSCENIAEYSPKPTYFSLRIFISLSKFLLSSQRVAENSCCETKQIVSLEVLLGCCCCDLQQRERENFLRQPNVEKESTFPLKSARWSFPNMAKPTTNTRRDSICASQERTWRHHRNKQYFSRFNQCWTLPAILRAHLQQLTRTGRLMMHAMFSSLLVFIPSSKSCAHFEQVFFDQQSSLFSWWWT